MLRGDNVRAETVSGETDNVGAESGDGEWGDRQCGSGDSEWGDSQREDCESVTELPPPPQATGERPTPQKALPTPALYRRRHLNLKP